MMIATVFSTDKKLCKECTVPIVISGCNFNGNAKIKLSMRLYYDSTGIAIENSEYQIDYFGGQNT